MKANDRKRLQEVQTRLKDARYLEAWYRRLVNDDAHVKAYLREATDALEAAQREVDFRTKAVTQASAKVAEYRAQAKRLVAAENSILNPPATVQGSRGGRERMSPADRLAKLLREAQALRAEIAIREGLEEKNK